MTRSWWDTGKVILKLAFLALALSFIFSRVFHQGNLSAIQNTLTPSFLTKNSQLIFLEFVLLLANIGVECFKWKFIMKDAVLLSWPKSLAGVLAGFASGMFTPNRTGEFVGRILYLPADARVKGILASMILSSIQLLCTVMFGITGIAILHEHERFNAELPSGIVMFWSFGILVTVLLILYLFFRWKINGKARDFFKLVTSFRKRSLVVLLGLSATRYIVFSIQFLIAMKLFGANAEASDLIGGIMVFYLLSTAVPSFIISELITRGAVAVFIFSMFNIPEISILLSSTFIWIMNIALPSLAGSFVITFRK